jgi:hypothetical protein
MCTTRYRRSMARAGQPVAGSVWVIDHGVSSRPPVEDSTQPVAFSRHPVDDSRQPVEGSRLRG